MFGKPKRMPKRKKFDGKWYERHGSAPGRVKRMEEIWAEARRKEGHSVRIVESPYGGYEAYIRW